MSKKEFYRVTLKKGNRGKKEDMLSKSRKSVPSKVVAAEVVLFIAKCINGVNFSQSTEKKDKSSTFNETHLAALYQS